MKSNIDKSLLEVWEMKADVEKEFLSSHFNNYLDYLEDNVKGIKEKYHIKTKNIFEHDKNKNKMQLN